MIMPGREFSSGGYRYGFNGKENDNEVKGTGSQQDYGFRIYDPRLGKFLSVDPLTKQYPELTPYQFASNRPIDGIDLDGKEWSKTTTYDIGTGIFNVHFDIQMNVINQNTTYNFSREQIDMILNDSKTQIESSFKGGDLNKNIVYSTSATFNVLNYEPDPNVLPAGYDENNNYTVELINTYTNRKTGEVTNADTKTIGNPKNNVIKLATTVDEVPRDTKKVGRTLAHENGHAAGLKHPWNIGPNDCQDDINQNDPAVDRQLIKTNLMNSDGNPDPALKSNDGKNVTPDQFKKVEQEIDKSNE